MRKSKISKSNNDKVFSFFCYAIVTFLTLSVLYPVIYIVSASFSNSDMVVQGKVWLLPVKFTLEAYEIVFNRAEIWIGYRNTIFYTVFGVMINLAMTLMCAYPLARKNLRGRGIIMFICSFTMMFSGGMVPSYILVRELGIMNTTWAMVLPGAMSVYNMIVCRTFIESNIPGEMLEAAQIDGCSNTQFFFRMVLPLSKAIIAVLALWYGVAHWNSYMSAFLYLRERTRYPLQIFLKEILIQSQNLGGDDLLDVENINTIAVTIKYSAIVIASVPLFCVYPFIQKHFQKGVMVGSVKG